MKTGSADFDRQSKAMALIGEARSLAARARVWWQEAVRDPLAAKHSLGHLLEEQSPALSRAFLSAAASLATPFTAGMGMRIERLDDNGCVAFLPDWWRNRGEDGRVHPAAVLALAEFCVRGYWNRHLEPASASAYARRLECRWLGGRGGAATRVSYSASDVEREDLLFRLRREGRAEASFVVHAHGEAGELVAELELEWEFSAPKLLAEGAADASVPDESDLSRPIKQK